MWSISQPRLLAHHIFIRTLRIPNIETISLCEYRIHCLSNHKSQFFILSLSNSEVLGNILKLYQHHYLLFFFNKFHRKAAMNHSFIQQIFLERLFVTGRDLGLGIQHWIRQTNPQFILNIHSSGMTLRLGLAKVIYHTNEELNFSKYTKLLRKFSLDKCDNLNQ